MKVWRMAFKEGAGWERMWPQCLNLSVAAITYAPLVGTDLSKFPFREPKFLWNQLASTPKASLSRFAYEMAEGDMIYVKDGPKIIDRGVVTGRYFFDSQYRMTDSTGLPWPHQVQVSWSRDFPPITIQAGRNQQMTVEELQPSDVELIRQEVRLATPSGTAADAIEDQELLHTATLIEAEYLRVSPAALKYIVPRHKKLSNDFCKWIHREYDIPAAQEQQRIDIRFRYNGLPAIVELKVCFGMGTTKAIREALGQLLEYNHYPGRLAFNTWLIVLDEKPAEEDEQFILALREKRFLPVALGWPGHKGFSFYPPWPGGA